MRNACGSESAEAADPFLETVETDCWFPFADSVTVKTTKDGSSELTFSSPTSSSSENLKKENSRNSSCIYLDQGYINRLDW